MQINSRLMVMLVAILMSIFGLNAAPANAAPKSVVVTQVKTTLSNNTVLMELTVKCPPGMTYHYQIFHLFQGETVGWNDDPSFNTRPCGARDTQFLWGMTGLYTTGKAELRTNVYLCKANNPTACTIVEVRKNLSLRA